MKFINTCNSQFEHNVLEKAIILQCEVRGITPKETYKIYEYRGYAGISLKHEKVSVHRIIGEYMFGSELPSNLHVHHINGDRYDNRTNNLQIVSTSFHVKKHNPVQYVPDEHKRSFGERMSPIIKRNDVTEDMVMDLRNQGYTYPQISEKLNCGRNTVWRRMNRVLSTGEVRNETDRRTCVNTHN